MLPDGSSHGCHGGAVMTSVSKKALSASQGTCWDCAEPVTVLVEDLVYVVPDKEFLPGCNTTFGLSKKNSRSMEGKKVLLNKINMIARPGEFLAIVGPSGGGKTTLLNVLAMRSPAYRVPSGRVTFNGRQETKESVKSTVNYVMAHDKLLPYLTVYESLVSAAALKLPHMTVAERQQRVEQVIDSMCLRNCRDHYIGGEWRKGISTGELKRVAIAVELLDEPSVLILDEPTSGLDSTLSARIIELLVREARRGRTIIATIHQPSSQVFAMFDRLLLLTMGSAVYHGPAADALDYFSRLGHTCSKEWNPCDFLLDMISPQKALQRGEENETNGVSFLENLATEWRESEDAKAVYKEIGDSNQSLKVTTPPRRSSKRLGANWCHEVKTLWKRTTRNSLRNPMSAIVILLIQAMQGLVLGGIFFHQSTAWAGPKPEPAISDEAWSSPWLEAYNFGLSNTDIPRPFVEMMEIGVDGYGSAVFVNDASPPGSLQQLAVRAIDHYSSCLYTKLNLPSRGYYNLTDLYEAPAEDWDSWTPQRIYSNLLGFYQILDYKYMDGATHDPLRLQFISDCYKADPTPGAFYQCLMTQSKSHVTPFLQCASFPDLPEFPTNPSRSLREAAADTAGKTHHFQERQQQSSEERLGEHHHANHQGRRLAPLTSQDVKSSSSLALGKGSDTFNKMVADILGPNLMKLLDAAGEWVRRATTCDSEICDAVRALYEFIVRWADGSMQTIVTALNLSGCLFFVSTILGFASYDALLTFPQERALFNRESANGLYRPSSYYVAKNIADLPFQLVPSLLMATIYYFMVGFDVTAQQFFTYFAICILTSFCAYGFGYMVSAAAPRMEIALLTAPLTLVVWLVLAGFFLRDGDIPKWIDWFKYLSFYRWSFFSFVINQFPPGKYFGTLSNTFILGLAGVTETNLTLTAWILTILGMSYRVFGYVFLATTNRTVGLEA